MQLGFGEGGSLDLNKSSCPSRHDAGRKLGVLAPSGRSLGGTRREVIVDYELGLSLSVPPIASQCYHE